MNIIIFLKLNNFATFYVFSDVNPKKRLKL